VEPAIAIAPRPATAGFSLIELLIAVAVLSVLAVGASLGGFAATRSAPSDGDTLIAATAEARRQALLQRSPQALILAADSLTAASASDDGWQPGPEIARWRQHPEPVASGPALPVTLVFLPDGRATPFAVTFVDGYQRILCQGDGWEAPGCAPR
jgi:prepilin-type N-terminal cleavage/methylation domain-containing protein